MLEDEGFKEQVRNGLLQTFGQVSRRFVRSARRVEGGSDRRRILVIRPDHLGDLLFVTPALALLRRAQPEAHIACLVGPWGQDVLSGNPDVDEVLTCDFPWFNRRPRRSLLEPYALLREKARSLAVSRFDVAINLRFDFWWGALLAHLAGIPEIIGYDRAGCRPFLTQALPYVPRRHEVEQNLRLVATLLERDSALLHGARDIPITFRCSAADEAFVESLLHDEALGRSDALFGIHPGAGAAIKLWTADGFAEVARRLLRRYDASVVITGSAGERAMAEEIAQRIDDKRVRVVAGQTSLGQLAALFRRCSVVIGVDSGPLHLAVAMGAPTVHLFGPSDPASFGPYGDARKHAIVSAGFECGPCGRLDITGTDREMHTCMLAIEPERVVEALEGVLASGG